MSAAPTGLEGLTIRAAGAFEAPVLAVLHEACFAGGPSGPSGPGGPGGAGKPGDPGEVWSAGAIARILDLPGAFALLAVPGRRDAHAGAALGLVLARIAADEAEILSLGVAPAARRAGVGRRLLDAAQARAQAAGARRLYLEVAEDNTAARRLYRGAGFARVGRRPGYYRRPDGAAAALVFARDLGPAASPQ